MKTKITELFGCKYPIFQGGMAWIAESTLASAVTNAGGVGIIAGGSAPIDYLREQIRICKEKVGDKPFGVNIMLMSPNAEDLAQLVIDEKVPMITTGAGNPGKYMAAWKEAGIKVVPVVPSVALARRMERSGADAIIAEAQAKAREMVEQSEVMQSAYAQANETVNNANQQAQEILDAATNDANSIRLGAIGYTDDMLANLSNIMTTALNDAGEKYNSFVESLTSCYNTVVQNRSELSPQGAPEEEQPEEEVVVPEYDPASEEESEEE